VDGDGTGFQVFGGFRFEDERHLLHARGALAEPRVPRHFENEFQFAGADGLFVDNELIEERSKSS
jgi:hypothetical protein